MNHFSVVVIAVAIAVLLCLPVLPERYEGVMWALSTSHPSKHNKTAVRRTSIATSSGSNIRNSRLRRHREKHLIALPVRHRTRQTASRPAPAHRKSRHVATRARYAYPMSLFLYQPPPFDLTPLPEDQCLKIRKAFAQGTAGEYPTRSLVKAHIVTYYPIRGGIFFRRELIKNIIMHSTEPGIPVGAKTVIDGWSHGGRRHPGAHYVVDRDGTIYQAVDPDLAAVHVNIFKTLPGFDNDNSVGIEMCHQGSQNYPPEQVQSVIKLVVYLQNHYHVPDSNVVTHRYAQQGDHTDPVNFAWNDFIADKASLQNQSLNFRLADLKREALAWQPIEELGPGKTKIYKGNKSVVVDQNKLSVPLTQENKVAEREQSANLTSAPIPSGNMANLIPITAEPVSRLVPASPANRLVPASFIINNSSTASSTSGGAHIINGIHEPTSSRPDIGSADLYQQIDEAVMPAASVNNQSKRQLPLKGPIEMDPNEAAGLLDQGTSGIQAK
jgi:hypothetical protein